LIQQHSSVHVSLLPLLGGVTFNFSPAAVHGSSFSESLLRSVSGSDHLQQSLTFQVGSFTDYGSLVHLEQGLIVELELSDCQRQVFGCCLFNGHIRRPTAENAQKWFLLQKQNCKWLKKMAAITKTIKNKKDPYRGNNQLLHYEKNCKSIKNTTSFPKSFPLPRLVSNLKRVTKKH